MNKYFQTNDSKYTPQLLVRKLVEEGSIEKCFPISIWPTCPNCDKCLIKDKCSYEELSKLNKRIKEVSLKKLIKSPYLAY